MINKLIMNSYPLDLLEVLLVVSKSKNFRDAAAVLKISQPAVSFKIKQLEALLPEPLFDLQGRKKVLTPYGLDLCRVIEKQSSHYRKELEDINRHYEKPENSILRIGGRIEVLDYLSEKINFKGRVEFLNLSNRMSLKMLSDRKIDIAISYSPPDSTELIAKKLFTSSSDLVIPKKLIKNFKSDLLDCDFFKNTPSIFYRKNEDILSEWMNHIGVKIDEMRIRYTVEDWRAVANLINQEIGYSIVPFYVETDLNKTIRINMTSEKLKKVKYYALFNRNLKKIKAFKDVLDAI